MRYWWKKGYSLIELMVVISVAAILMTVAVVVFSTVQKGARDAKRKDDIEAIHQLFEQYYQNNLGYGDCDQMIAESGLGILPKDPLNRDGYVYNLVCNASGDYYCVCAKLERENGNADSNDCVFDDSGSEPYYCIESVQ